MWTKYWDRLNERQTKQHTTAKIDHIVRLFTICINLHIYFGKLNNYLWVLFNDTVYYWDYAVLVTKAWISMKCWKDGDRKTEALRTKPVPVPFCPPQISRRLFLCVMFLVVVIHIKNWQARLCTYSECVFVALGIQPAMSMRHVICGLPSSTILFHIIS